MKVIILIHIINSINPFESGSVNSKSSGETDDVN